MTKMYFLGLKNQNKLSNTRDMLESRRIHRPPVHSPPKLDERIKPNDPPHESLQNIFMSLVS